MAVWTEEEIKILKKKYPIYGPKIPNLKNRTEKAIKTKAQTLGISYYKYETIDFSKWTVEEEKILKEKYIFCGTEIQELLKTRTHEAIKRRARKLGLKKIYKTYFLAKSNIGYLYKYECQICKNLYPRNKNKYKFVMNYEQMVKHEKTHEE